MPGSRKPVLEMKYSFDNLPFTNSFAALAPDFYARVQPTPFESEARLLHFNTQAAELLDLDPAVRDDPRFVDVFSGRRQLPGMDPVAMLYAGHQFGHYVPQLGDGRAIILGETLNSRGEHWELQLKGSGQTPYSRAGDGRAVLRSSIREYLCGEAMHALGIPSTRALCLIGSADEVYREQIETGAMITRLAPTHVRFGSFEVFFYREQYEHIGTLADYVIDRHYPRFSGQPDRHEQFLRAVVERTAHLIAQWQAVGFAHGVMNSDNMSILGITLDYGPFGFMEAFDPKFICNHSDHSGRYAFDQQPKIGLFNLSCLAQALLPLMHVDVAKDALESYWGFFTPKYQQLMAQKLGFAQPDAQTSELLEAFLAQLQHSHLDYSLSFRALGDVQRDTDGPLPALRDQFIDRERFDRWLADYRARLRTHAGADPERRAAMQAVNPKYVLRNYLAQIAIEKAERGDVSEIERLMTLLRAPFDEQPGQERYALPAPDSIAAIQVSCSS